jgi:hypothetical protein
MKGAMTMATSITHPTKGQIKQAERFVGDCASAALSEAGLDKGCIQKLLGRGPELKAELAKVLRSLSTVFEVWKTIVLGTLLNPSALIRELEAKGLKISDYARDIMGKKEFAIASSETTVDLVIRSVKELGFTRATPLREIYAKAQEIGLGLCPAEVGPQLRLQYTDQPIGEILWIAMESISVSDGSAFVFRVRRDGGGQWLNASWNDLDDSWNPGDRFVFVARKPLGT